MATGRRVYERCEHYVRIIKHTEITMLERLLKRIKILPIHKSWEGKICEGESYHIQHIKITNNDKEKRCLSWDDHLEGPISFSSNNF